MLNLMIKKKVGKVFLITFAVANVASELVSSFVVYRTAKITTVRQLLRTKILFSFIIVYYLYFLRLSHINNFDSCDYSMISLDLLP